MNKEIFHNWIAQAQTLTFDTEFHVRQEFIIDKI